MGNVNLVFQECDPADQLLLLHCLLYSSCFKSAFFGTYFFGRTMGIQYYIIGVPNYYMLMC